jgi:two-component system, OmpR family, response regulator
LTPPTPTAVISTPTPAGIRAAIPAAAIPGANDGMKVLVIEDDRQAAAYLAKGLRESGHAVDMAHDGKEGLYLAGSEDYDVMIVDRMLPGRDGLSVVEFLRAAGNETPVLFLSAMASVEDRVKGLRAGGDDYLTKPYAFAELLARLEILGRRSRGAGAGSGGGGPLTKLTLGDLEMDLLTRQARRGDKAIDLLPREFALLEFLLRNAGAVVTRTMMLESVWDYHFDPQTNVIDVHIARLRQKIDRDFAYPLIHTVRGAGYCLKVPDDAAS